LQDYNKMDKTNEQLIDQFFKAYSNHDMAGIEKVMSRNVVWTFLGQHKLAGVKKGINEVMDFFDKMGSIMADSKPDIDKLIVASNDNYVIECQHIKTNREDGINIDHFVTVLWTFGNGKIIFGRHFFADPKAADIYFNAVPVKSTLLIGFVPVVVEQTFHASVNQVWNAITDENQMKRWYFDTIGSFEPEVGFETEFNVRSNGKDYFHLWKVTDVEYEKRIAYTWKYAGYSGEALVSFELIKQQGNQTLLRLITSGIETFPVDNADFSRESWTEGWTYFICKQLKDFLEE